jgi:hypothetical protein
MYGPFGNPRRRDETGSSGRALGQDLDLTVGVLADAHSQFLLGYSYFWNGPYIDATGAGDNPDYLYFQYKFRF